MFVNVVPNFVIHRAENSIYLTILFGGLIDRDKMVSKFVSVFAENVTDYTQV